MPLFGMPWQLALHFLTVLMSLSLHQLPTLQDGRPEPNEAGGTSCHVRASTRQRLVVRWKGMRPSMRQCRASPEILQMSSTCRVQVLAYVSRVKDVDCTVDNETFTIEDVEANDVRCPDQEAAKLMYKGGCSRCFACPTPLVWVTAPL